MLATAVLGHSNVVRRAGLPSQSSQIQTVVLVYICSLYVVS